MASELRVNTLKDAAGNNSIATSVVAGGTAKVFSATATTAVTSIKSLNVSSLTDESNSDPNGHSVNITNAMDSANYAISACVTSNSSGVRRMVLSHTKTTSKYTIEVTIDGAGATSVMADSVIHGDLA